MTYQWTLKCHYCPANILLRHKSQEQTSEDQPDWPMDTWSLTLVCGNQERVSVYTPSNVRRLIQKPGQDLLSPDLLYSAKVPCGRENCGTIHEVHIHIDEDAPLDEIRGVASLAMKAMPCGTHPFLEPKNLTAIVLEKVENLP